MVVFSHFNVAVDEGRSAFPVYASAYALQGGIDSSLQRRLDWKSASSYGAFG
ncbi:hypothetical protein P4V60_17330 [Brevibacillus porteri]|uniref:hypothetical protein n=1 Tax=Brevibacillus porteri TaxID=2126350 RepID=UPI002E1B905E|nr:hypothetical protein [Brevibacillus porteri]